MENRSCTQIILGPLIKVGLLWPELGSYAILKDQALVVFPNAILKREVKP